MLCGKNRCWKLNIFTGEIPFLNLTELNCGQCANIRDDHVASLIHLKKLKLCWRLTDDAIINLINLTYLELEQGSRVSAACIMRLVNLEVLIVAHAHFTEIERNYIIESGLTKLTEITVI